VARIESLTTERIEELIAASVVPFGTTLATVVQGNDARVVNAVQNTCTINGHALSSSITLDAADVGAVASPLDYASAAPGSMFAWYSATSRPSSREDLCFNFFCSADPVAVMVVTMDNWFQR